MRNYRLIKGDCLDVLKRRKTGSVDLIFGSPPYEDAREYGELEYKLKGTDWVHWMLPRIEEMVRVSKGLVALVVSDKTEHYQWTATVPLLITVLYDKGYNLRRPPLYVSQGIPGSGGKDWLANRYETVICITHCPGPLPWADNTACGHPPKYQKGGNYQNRDRKGKRANRQRKPLGLANPGNIIDCGANTHFGDGNENEAPFPEKLARFFVCSFCPPGGIVVDPFCGGGTTGVAAIKAGRKFVGIDKRASQIKLSTKRLGKIRAGMGLG